MKPDTRNRRGMAMMLVISLLVFLAVLGISFLVISRLHHKQRSSMSIRSQADPIATGLAEQAARLLAEDLFMYDGTTEGRTYSQVDRDGAGAATQWFRFIDCPFQADSDEQSVDPWLASTVYDANADEWPHLSNLHDFDTGDVNGIDADADGLVDIDGDEEGDARLFPTGVFTPEGEEFYAAVRIVDLSSLLSANTAGQPESPDPLMLPTFIDIEGFFGDNGWGPAYADILQSREGNPMQPLDMETYWQAGGRRLLDPLGDILPFGIGDEMFLRTLSEESILAGRLYEATQIGGTAMPPELRRFLTTYNVSRALLRYPEDDYVRAPSLDLDLSDGNNRQELYEYVLRMFRRLNVADNDEIRKMMAAHFVANLWAYRSNDSDSAFDFQPSGEDFIVYGLLPGLAITEIYAYNEPDTDPGIPTQDYKYACALELTNFGPGAVELDDYKLLGLSGDPTLPSGAVGSKDKVVLYNWGKGANAGSASLASVGLPDPLPAGQDWRELSQLEFDHPPKTITLVRDVGGTLVPVDQFTVGDEKDLDYNITEYETIFTEAQADSRRDDRYVLSQDPPHYRGYAAVYRKQSDPTAKPHRLGQWNHSAFDASDRAAISSEVGYSLPIFHTGEKLTSIAELANIYLIGPWKDTAEDELHVFSKMILETEITEVLPDGPNRGRPDVFPLDYSGGADGNVSQIPSDGWGQAGGPTYPSVPLATLLEEFFILLQPDETREESESYHTRIYGRVNVNSAPLEVLERLPFFDGDTHSVAGVTIDVSNTEAAEAIIAYRDREISPSGASGLSGLLAGGVDDTRGFLTPGEVAIPLAMYIDQKLEDQGVTMANARKHATYVVDRDAPFRNIANMVTVQSDAYAAYILVQLGHEQTPNRWKYLVVFDRSNCIDAGDMPARLMFKPLY